jgi:hypothetical protein
MYVDEISSCIMIFQILETTPLSDEDEDCRNNSPITVETSRLGSPHRVDSRKV